MDNAVDQHKANIGAKSILLVITTLIWALFDGGTKYIAQQHELGEVFTDPSITIAQFRLVHNTGGAWGIFSNSAVVLGIISIAVCVVLFAYFVMTIEDFSYSATFGLALIIAGGLGNTIDRLTLGYVIDFIDLTFMNFPVFNVADIGVVAGIIIFVLALVATGKFSSKQPN